MGQDRSGSRTRLSIGRPHYAHTVHTTSETRAPQPSSCHDAGRDGMRTTRRGMVCTCILNSTIDCGRDHEGD